jgi:ABC-2 type transport system permease protein
MFDAGKLWRERFGRTSKELGRYLRYIFNGHLVVVFIFLLGSGAYYYQDFVKSLSPDFPIEIIMSVTIAILLTYSPIYTFLLDADRIFLLPLENKLSSYFRNSMLVSLGLQIYLLLMLLALLMPMYSQVNQEGFGDFFLFLLIITLIKGWNLLVRWQIQYFVETSVQIIDSFVRYWLNAIFLYFLFSGESIYMAVLGGLMVFLFVYFRNQIPSKGLKWERLIELEEKRMTSFYRIANMFTDVPKLKDRVKRRKWLDGILNLLSYKQELTYLHLYIRTFFRAGDYLGLVFRLTVIGSGALFLVSNGIGQVVIVVLFLYLTGFQLLPMWNHHQNKIWVSLYPLEEGFRERAFNRLLLTILLVESVTFTLMLIGNGDLSTILLAFVSAIAFTYYFVFFYSKKRLKWK